MCFLKPSNRILPGCTLGVAVHLFPVVMAVAEAKEPRIAGRTAIRVLKQHMVKEPIFEAAFSRMEEFFATAIGTTRDSSLRSGFVHGEFLLLGTSITASYRFFSRNAQLDRSPGIAGLTAKLYAAASRG